MVPFGLHFSPTMTLRFVLGSSKLFGTWANMLTAIFTRAISCKRGKHVGEGGGIATYRGMSAHPIIGGSPLYLALKLCHKVAHNPNIDLLILTFACTYINKKLCLKMCFLRKLLLCASRTYILASSTINCAENVVMHFQTRV